MTILRNGKEIDKSSPLVTKKSKETPVEEEKDESESLGLDDIEQCLIPPPFPQALKLPRKLDTASEILEHLYSQDKFAIIACYQASACICQGN